MDDKRMYFNPKSGLNKKNTEYDVVYVQGRRIQVEKGAYVAVPTIFHDIMEENRNEIEACNQDVEMIYEA